jgi:phosphoenolpyruvate carboxykinase (GTP)
VRKYNPMANLDFISVPLGTYIENHLKFTKDLRVIPKIYATNYFLKDESSNYLNSKLDKKVWLLWAEGRVHGEYEAIKTPVGLIPKYEDLKTLFIRELDKDYTEAEYVQQFSLRVTKYLEKMERMSKIFRNIQMPVAFSEELKAQTERLKLVKTKYGEDIISPFKFLEK